jgi:hypothetical protein
MKNIGEHKSLSTWLVDREKIRKDIDENFVLRISNLIYFMSANIRAARVNPDARFQSASRRQFL